MSKSPRPDGEGYAVEVSLLKFQPLTLALAAACLVTLVALLGWLGFGDVRQIAASQPQNNPAANPHLRGVVFEIFGSWFPEYGEAALAAELDRLNQTVAAHGRAVSDAA